MDGKTSFYEWISEKSVISKDSFRRERVIFLENYGGCSLTEGHEEKLKQLKSSLNYLLPNSTRFLQPFDSFIIENI